MQIGYSSHLKSTERFCKYVRNRCFAELQQISSGGHGYCNSIYMKDASYLTEACRCPSERLFLGNRERDHAKDIDS